MTQQTLPQPKSLRVLVVDDDADTVLSTSLLLQAWGHQAVPAISGNEALEKAATDEPDVIVLDLAMPGVSGFDLVRYIRQRTYRKRPFLIAQTGLTDEEHRCMAREAGVDLLFIKPVPPDALQSVVDRFGQFVAEG